MPPRRQPMQRIFSRPVTQAGVGCVGSAPVDQARQVRRTVIDLCHLEVARRT